MSFARPLLAVGSHVARAAAPRTAAGLLARQSQLVVAVGHAAVAGPSLGRSYASDRPAFLSAKSSTYVDGRHADTKTTRDERRLYVGNLPLDMTEDALRDFTAEFSPATVELGPAKPAAVAAHAFLTFETAEQAQSALAVLEASSLGRGPLTASLATRLPTAEEAEKAAARKARKRERREAEQAAYEAERTTWLAAVHPPSRALFVAGFGGVPDERFVAEVERLLGDSLKYTISRTDRDEHGGSSSFAFINFQDVAQATEARGRLQALSFGGHRRITVEFPRDKRAAEGNPEPAKPGSGRLFGRWAGGMGGRGGRGSFGGGRQGGGGGGGGGGGPGGFVKGDRPSRPKGGQFGLSSGSPRD